MDEAKVDRQLILVEWDLPERRYAQLEADGIDEGELSSAWQTSSYTSEKELIRLYEEGKRDFSRANLQGASLQGVSLQQVRLIMANLSKAEMSGARLDGAKLSMANMRGAKLQGANLIGANLRGADLNKANLRNADLNKADLREADLRGADLHGADLLEAKLTGAKLDNETRISGTWRLIWEIVNRDSNGHDPDEADLEETDLSCTGPVEAD